jgi:hypothetical protein
MHLVGGFDIVPGYILRFTVPGLERHDGHCGGLRAADARFLRESRKWTGLDYRRRRLV